MTLAGFTFAPSAVADHGDDEDAVFTSVNTDVDATAFCQLTTLHDGVECDGYYDWEAVGESATFVSVDYDHSGQLKIYQDDGTPTGESDSESGSGSCSGTTSCSDSGREYFDTLRIYQEDCWQSQATASISADATSTTAGHDSDSDSDTDWSDVVCV